MPSPAPSCSDAAGIEGVGDGSERYSAGCLESADQREDIRCKPIGVSHLGLAAERRGVAGVARIA